MNDNEITKEVPKSKPSKKKGPIRFEAIIPALILVALIGAYFTFLFDFHLRSALEYGATYAHGAEVNIDSVSTSFTAPSLEIRKIQITDKNKPTRNLFQVGSIKFGLLWDALLRAKVVVEEASINNIEALVPRDRPGRVLPPEAKEGSGLAKVEDAVVEQTKKDYEGNILGDVAQIVDGTDPAAQLKNIEADLKASGKIAELEKELKLKEKQWKERLETLPGSEKIKELEARIKKLKFDTKNPIQFAKDLQEADKIIREVDQTVKNIEQTSKDLKGDINKYEQAFKDVEKMVQEDIKDLQKRLNIPDINPAEFSKKLFGKMIAEKLGSLRKYVALGREYMPPKKTKEEKRAGRLVPRRRGEGDTFKFPVTTSYPLFWLKKASISSEVSESEYSGNIKGEITNLTTEPPLVGKPLMVSVMGDFPKQQILGFSSIVNIDHTTNEPKESLELKVGSYPVGGQDLSNSEDVTFNITKANGELNLKGIQTAGKIDIDINHKFKSVEYEVDAKSSLVKDVLQGVASDVSLITVDAQASGEWDSLAWRLKSNLGDALVNSFKAQVQKKVNEAKEKLNQLVNEKIGAEREKLTAEYNKIKNQVDQVIGSKRTEIEKAKQQAKNEVDKKKKSTPSGKSLEEEGKKLLEGLGF